MIQTKKHGNYINDKDEHIEKKQKQLSNTKFQDKNQPIEKENDLDPELRKINDVGRRVGWTYRYRIRRKLNDLKRQQAGKSQFCKNLNLFSSCSVSLENGIKFDLTTLTTISDKKRKMKSKKKKTIESAALKSNDKKKSVGWQYRYRVSKMHETQKHKKLKAPTNPNQDKILKVKPELARRTSKDQNTGSKYWFVNFIIFRTQFSLF